MGIFLKGGGNMSNANNLKVPTSEEARLYGAMGGKKSGEVRKSKKKLKECMEAILSAKVINTKTQKELEELGIEGEEMTNKVLLTAALFQKALTGEVAAFREIRNLIGEDTNGAEDVLDKLDEVLGEIGGNI